MIPTFLLAFGVTVAALQNPAFQPDNNRFYADLFRVLPELRAQAAAARAEPRVVCGMLVIPVDPDFDARMRIHAPERPDHKIRVISPPVCAD